MKLKRQSVDLRRFLGTEVPLARITPALRRRVREALDTDEDLSALSAEVTRELVDARVFARAGVVRRGSDRIPVYSLPGSPRVYDIQGLMDAGTRANGAAEAPPRDDTEARRTPTVRPESDPSPTPERGPAPTVAMPGPNEPRLDAIEAVRRTLERDWISFGLEASLEGLLELLSNQLGDVDLRAVLWSEPLGLGEGSGRAWRILHGDKALEAAFRRSLEGATNESVAYEGRRWVPLRVADQVVGAVGSSRPLEAAVRTTVARALEALLTAHRRSQQRVFTDPLTGLHNRRFFDSQLGLEVERSQRMGQPLAVLFVDLDHFKRVNDERGHQMGDLVLQHVARLMLQHLRRIDQVFRWGGEEFALLLPGTGREDAMHTAERLRSVIERTPLALPGGHRVPMTVSVGVALAPEHAQGGDRALLRHADEALYRAKDSGRNRVCLYGAD